MKTIFIEGVGEVELRKSARARKMIISIPNDDLPRVTIPRSLPFIVAKQFALQQAQWLRNHSQKNTEETTIRNGMSVGTQHKIVFKAGERLSSRVSSSQITVTHPAGSNPSNSEVQKEAKKAATRAMRRQAEQFLPTRTYQLAQTFGYQFREVRVKSLKTRWGSCSSQKVINLNIWLMQLPVELIDYVITHELSHLRHPHHQPEFWAELSNMTPNYKELRKQLKNYHPKLIIQP